MLCGAGLFLIPKLFSGGHALGFLDGGGWRGAVGCCWRGRRGRYGRGLRRGGCLFCGAGLFLRPEFLCGGRALGLLDGGDGLRRRDAGGPFHLFHGRGGALLVAGCLAVLGTAGLDGLMDLIDSGGAGYFFYDRLALWPAGLALAGAVLGLYIALFAGADVLAFGFCDNAHLL